MDKPLFTFPPALRGDPAHLSACLPHTQTALHSAHCQTIFNSYKYAHPILLKLHCQTTHNILLLLNARTQYCLSCTVRQYSTHIKCAHAILLKLHCLDTDSHPNCSLLIILLFLEDKVKLVTQIYPLMLG